MSSNSGKFSFRGRLIQCGNKKPHPPHEIKIYDKDFYGALTEFCLGRSGLVKGGNLRIIIDNFTNVYKLISFEKGYAVHGPQVCLASGHYYVEKETLRQKVLRLFRSLLERIGGALKVE